MDAMLSDIACLSLSLAVLSKTAPLFPPPVPTSSASSSDERLLLSTAATGKPGGTSAPLLRLMCNCSLWSADFLSTWAGFDDGTDLSMSMEDLRFIPTESDLDGVFGVVAIDRLPLSDTDEERVRFALELRLDSLRSLAGFDGSLVRRVCSLLGSRRLLEESLLRGSLLGSLSRRLLDRFFSFIFLSKGPAEDDRLCLRSSSREMVMPPTTDAEEGVYDRRLLLLAELITL